MRNNIVWFFIFIFVLFLVVILSLPASLEAARKQKELNLSIDIQFEDNNPKLKEQLQTLTDKMLENAKLYKTTDQKVYCQSEAKESFYKLLSSQGYYNALISAEFSESNPNLIIFYIKSGNRYKLSKIRMIHKSTSNYSIKLPSILALPIKENYYAIAEKILASQNYINDFIEEHNCLLEYVVSHEVVVNHVGSSIEVTFIVEASKEATIKSVSFEGLKLTKPNYLRKIVSIKEGQCFKNLFILEAKSKLQKSGLFSSISSVVSKEIDKNNQVPVIFKLTERKARSIKAGMNYGTDFGIGLTSGWEHRNLFGRGEEAKVNLSTNKKEQSINTTFTKQFFKRDDQRLKLSLALENKQLKAFDSREGAIFAGIEREISNIWSFCAGVKYSYATVKDKVRKTQDFSLLSFPVFIARDNRDNILDPHNGHLIKLETEPFFLTKKKGPNFVKNSIFSSWYIDLKNNKFYPVIALKGAAGSILGANLSKAPVIEGFYVGGSGSIRGYAYQLVGELDTLRRPFGGRSFIEASVELRIKVKEDIGIVTFLDAGHVYSGFKPDFKKKIIKGAGFGFRYYTNFGPLRADIGFPLNRRKKIDKAFQLYFSIGQSF